jgi:hypothetical protein
MHQLIIDAARAPFPSQQLLTIPVTRKLPIGQCYANVAAVVQRHGGVLQPGWGFEVLQTAVLAKQPMP